MNDWVCAGGDRGKFTSFYVGDGDKPGKPHVLLQFSDEELARMPLVIPPRISPDGTYKPHISRAVGDDVVNCITLWFPSESSLPTGYEEPVAVAALNDSSVVVLTLPDSDVMDLLTYPDYVNRAVISPKGDLLIAM